MEVRFFASLAATAPVGPDQDVGSSAWPKARWRAALLLLVLATFVIRARYFGNPFVHVDEQFYLLTGDRMLHGAIPYVDIWDRKPVGLFLIFAGIRMLGGDGIVQYQLVATGFAAATALMVAVMARRITTPGAALIAALAYVPALAMNDGAGGQAPVFYNLPVALAAYLILGLVQRPDPAAIRWRGAAAMLLIGVALQIKYSAVFEGMFFGIILIWLAWRAQRRLGRLAFDIGLWVAMALLPTASAFLWYAGIGQTYAFLYANFISISARTGIPPKDAWHNLRRIIARFTPFLLAILVGEWLLRDFLRWPRRHDSRVAHGFLAGWLLAALSGFALFGSYFDHYALPLLVPILIVAAPAFELRYRRAGQVLGFAVLLVLFLFYLLDARKLERDHGDAAYARLLVAHIVPHLHGRCAYVFVGEPILYHLTGSCLPSRWVFPFHLSLQREAYALGVDPLVEAKRIMASRPPVVIDRVASWDPDTNEVVQIMVRGELARHYRLAWSYTHPDGGDPDTDMVWVLPGQ